MADPAQLNRIERRKMVFRDRITTAAFKLFEKNGISNTSIASIIKEADIAHKTFFNHFPTKDHLLFHIADDFSSKAYKSFRQEFKTVSDPKDCIALCFMGAAEGLVDVHPNYKALLNIYLISGAGANDLVSQQDNAFKDLISEILIDAQNKNMLSDEFSIEVYTDMIAGICVATLRSWSLIDDYPLIEKMKNAIAFINSRLFIEP